MLVYRQDNPDFNYYRINEYDQYEIIKDLLIPKIEIVAKSAFKYDPDLLINIIEMNLKKKNNNFALWVGFSNKRIIAYATTFITISDDIPTCVIHNLWVDTKHYLLLFKKAMPMFDPWAAEHGAKRIIFYTNHKIDRMRSVFNRMNWKPRLRMEKELD